MQTLTFNDPRPRGTLPQALAQAADAARKLQDAGCEVHTAFDNGRRMVLLIDAPPPFVTGHRKSWHPNGRGGITSRYAASYQGCVLEWTVDTAAEVIHG